MAWQGVPYLIPLMVAAIVSVISALYIWQYYHTAVAKTLALTLLAGTGWLLCHTLRLSNTDLITSIPWLNVDTLLLNITFMGWFIFTFQYTEHEKWVTRRNVALLSIIPVITLLLLSTEYHGLVYGSGEKEGEGGLVLPEFPRGAWFWFAATCAYGLILFGDFLLIQMFIRAPRFYRSQIALLLFVLVLLQLANLLSIAGLSPFSSLLVIALLLSVAGPVAALCIFRYRVTDIVPVARATVIDGMSDGVMVLDPQNRILDINPLVQYLIGSPAPNLIGKPVQEVWPDWLNQAEPRNGIQTGKEITLNLGDEQRTYDIRNSPLTDRQGHLVSRVVVLRDITDRKQAEMQLESIFEASKLINSTMDINEIFKFVSDSCQKLVGFDYFTVFLVSKDKKSIYRAYAVGEIKNETNSVLEYGEGVVGHCIKTRETILLGNIHNDGTERNVVGTTDPVASQIILPLVIEDQCVGALHISKVAENGYDHHDVRTLKPLSEGISSAVRNSNLYSEIKQFGEELEQKIKRISEKKEILLNTRQQLQKERSWKKGLISVIESMKKLGFDRVGVFLVDRKEKKLEFHSGIGIDHLEAGASLSLEKREYFGVQCVLKKKTIHIKDPSPGEGKRLFESNSCVWIPIIVQDEIFAALAAGNVTGLIADEDIKDLEILGGMCGAFIDRTRIQIEPVTEKTLNTEIKYQLNPLEGYLILEKKPKKSFEIFVDLVTHGVSGFVVSRDYPEKLKKKYDLVRTPMLWLSRTEQENTVKPDDLPKLTYIIEDFTRKIKESVILIDGLEYLITQSGFDAVLKFLQELKDTVILNNSRLIIPVHREALSPQNFSILEREFIILEPDMYLFSFLE